MINELELHSKDMLDSVRQSVDLAKKDIDFIRLDKKTFESSQSDSIDYALMEKTDNVFVIPLDVGWNDIGSWSSLWDTNAKDKNNNSSQGDVILHNTKNSYVRSNERLIATIGLDNIVVVDH